MHEMSKLTGQHGREDVLLQQRHIDWDRDRRRNSNDTELRVQAPGEQHQSVCHMKHVGTVAC